MSNDLYGYINSSSVDERVFYLCETHRNVTVYISKSEDGEIEICWERQPNTTDEIYEDVGDFHYDKSHTH